MFRKMLSLLFPKRRFRSRRASKSTPPGRRCVRCPKTRCFSRSKAGSLIGCEVGMSWSRALLLRLLSCSLFIAKEALLVLHCIKGSPSLWSRAPRGTAEPHLNRPTRRVLVPSRVVPHQPASTSRQTSRHSRCPQKSPKRFANEVTKK